VLANRHRVGLGDLTGGKPAQLIAARVLHTDIVGPPGPYRNVTFGTRNRSTGLSSPLALSR
jgi:hypothetical protein